MASEHVVRLRDEDVGEVQLDINNGYVYDLQGHQIGHWSPVESNHNGELADLASDEVRNILAHSLESAVRFDGREDLDRARAKQVRMTDWKGEPVVLSKEGSVRMDIGIADVHQPAAMPDYAAGYRNAPPCADVFAPPMLRGKPSDKYYTFDKNDAFQRAQPTVGGTSAQVNEISPRLANDTYTTVEYALGGFVGTQLEAAADAPLRIRQATIKRVLNALLIEREIRVAILATLATNWDSSIVATIAAGAKWNGGATSDPIADIQTAMEASWGDVTGIIMNQRVFHTFQRNPNVQKYFMYKTGVAPLPTPNEMSPLLTLPPIYVSRMKYINSAGALDYVWGNDIVLFRMPEQMPPTTQDDVATALTFRWDGATTTDGAASNGMLVREYFVQDRGTAGGNKVVLIHHDVEVMTSKFVGGILKSVWQ